MDYYNSSDEATPSQAQDQSEGKETQEHEDSEQTALIPKTLFAGKDFKVGDEIVLKIVHLYENEAEVEYASEPSKEEKPKSMMEEVEGGLDRMAKPMMEA